MRQPIKKLISLAAELERWQMMYGPSDGGTVGQARDMLLELAEKLQSKEGQHEAQRV
jgi:hypothetical protein